MASKAQASPCSSTEVTCPSLKQFQQLSYLVSNDCFIPSVLGAYINVWVPGTTTPNPKGVMTFLPQWLHL